MRKGVGGTVAATLIASTNARSQTPHPSKAPSFGNDLLFLVHRLTQGYTVEEHGLAQSLGYEGYLEHHLNAENIDDSEVEGLLSAFPTLGLDHYELRHEYGNTDLPYRELKTAALFRAIYSRRQLKERMVEFWTDHFNINHEGDELSRFKTVDDRDVIRQHALGSFRDMLYASAMSTAMLHYLDNHLNTKVSPNENYARELMELHTLGADGPYQEFDVKNVARCFTGWSYSKNDTLSYGRFKYNAWDHDDDQKTVLGTVIPPGLGRRDGEIVLDILIAHPKTADYVCRKMCKWLLAYDPPESHIREVAKIFQFTRGDIKSVLRAIFRQDRVRRFSPWNTVKHKRPIHFVTSVLRATHATVAHDLETYDLLLRELAIMGQVPFAWPSPDGYPDSIAQWGGAAMPRWAFASQLLGRSFPGIDVDMDFIGQYVSQWPPGEFGIAIMQLMGGGFASPQDEAEIQRFLDESPYIDANYMRQAIAHAAWSPSFQYY